ncbi:MAG TPA: Ig-like domain-containing protein, partial [Thermoanaerobaculia bacterium]|nr:Ig-like domain-containing protein [Thermoanaerobaculia bacterium]
GLEVSGATTLGTGSTIASADLDAPVITVTAPAAATLFVSGDSVTVTADVTDDSTITGVVFEFGEQSVNDTGAPWEATLPAPVVAVEQDVDVTVTATDDEGNVGTATLTVRVRPLAPGDPPVVSYLCPTPGARLAAGTGLDLTVEASHDDGIEKVDFLVGDDPTVLATDTTAPYQFHLTVPAGAVEGDVVAFRARARSFNGNTAEAVYTVTVVDGQVVTADTFLAAGDTSFDGASVIVAGGTLTVEGAHTFRDLTVLDGAAVSHPVAGSLDLSLTRDLYVACGGSVDAGGQGWPEASFETGFTGGDLSDWTVWDVPGANSAPSDWVIDSSGTGYLRQWTNIHYPTGTDRLGTLLLWDAGASLSDYRVASRMRSDDDDGIGFVFRYQDENNYYRFLWYASGDTSYARRLEKRVGGTFQVLAQDTVWYSRYSWYDLEIVADGPRLQVWTNGGLVFDVEDSEFASGTFGMAASGNVNSIWDDVRVIELGGVPSTGGSHGGRSGGFAGDGRVFGSLFDPDLPGAGGAGSGTRGGGAVRLAIGGDAIVDGAINAAGDSAAATGAHGAGGSVRLDATAIRGTGSIDASGGGSASTRLGGGGGRVALYAATIDAGLLTRTTAAGGEASTSASTGAAGTVYVKRDGQPFGDLVIDNAGRATDHYTELVSVPSGTVSSLGVPAGGVDTMTDTGAAFPSSLVGAELAIAGSTGGPWPIVGHDDLGDTLSVDVAAAPLDAVPGDDYEVIYRFDSVTVRGGAQAISLATVQSTQSPDVEAGSSWQVDYAPSLAFGAPADGATYTAGAEIVFSAVVDDALGVSLVTLDYDGQSWVDDSAPFTWTFTAPIVAAATSYDAALTASDHSGHPLSDQITIQVAPNSDPTMPQVAIDACPADGDTVVPGVPLGLGFTASDVEQLYAWRVKVDGVVVDEATAIDAGSA